MTIIVRGSLSVKPDLTEVDIGTRPYAIDVVPEILVGFIGLYRHPPVARVDGPKDVFPIYIHHFYGIPALNGPDPVGSISRDCS
jgi:hypothetical protein